MSTIAQKIEEVVGNILHAAEAKLLPLATDALPFPLGELLSAALSLPAVKAEIAKLEKAAEDEAAKLYGAAAAEVSQAVANFLHNHPKLAALWSAAEGSPVFGAVEHLAAEEVKAFFALQTQGRWGELRAFLVTSGVL